MPLKKLEWPWAPINERPATAHYFPIKKQNTMDLRKELTALDPLQSALDKLKSSQLAEKSAMMKIEDEAKSVERYLAKPAGTVFFEQDRDLLDKLTKSTLGANSAMDELLKASGNVPGWASAMQDTSFLTAAQTFADAEVAKTKKMHGTIAEFSMANGLADALETIDATEPFLTINPLAIERLHSMNRDFSRRRELENEKLELARATATAMQAALAAAERREVDAKAEAAESKGDAKFFKLVAVVGLAVAVITGFIASWEPVVKWVSPSAQQSK
jgi:hypothetical protein